MQQHEQEVAVNFRLPVKLHQQMRLLAQRERRSLNQQLVRVLEEWLASNELAMRMETK